MMREYKSYDEYQDSEVEWIGEIPEGWETVKLKFITKCLDNLRIPLNSTERAEMKGNIPYWGANSIVDNVNDWLVDGEVILLGEDGAPFFDKLKNVAFYSNEKIWPNNHVHVLKVISQNNIKFIIYSLNITDYTAFITGSTRDKLNQSAMSEIPIPSTTQNEQQKIASFLDQKTAEIDKIINKKESLIDQLEKYKKSVITEAVTKGKLGDKYINEDGELVDEIEMKDSGVEWIGEIPEYWDVSKLKYICKEIKTGSTPSTSKEKYFDGNINWITPGDFQNNFIIKNSERKLSKIAIKEGEAPYFSDITLIIGIGATTGKVSHIYVNTSFNQQITGLVTDKKLLNQYYFSLSLSNFKETLKNIALYTTLPIINNETLSNFIVPYPNKKIQTKITNFINQKFSELNNLIQKTKESIEKYKEYKKSLIFEAVTGKIDLRDYELKGGEELAEHRDTKTADRKRVSKVN